MKEVVWLMGMVFASSAWVQAETFQVQSVAWGRDCTSAASCSISLINSSDAPVDILAGVSDCSCAVLRVSPSLLKPRGDTQVVLCSPIKEVVPIIITYRQEQGAQKQEKIDVKIPPVPSIEIRPARALVLEHGVCRAELRSDAGIVILEEAEVSTPLLVADLAGAAKGLLVVRKNEKATGEEKYGVVTVSLRVGIHRVVERLYVSLDAAKKP